MLVASLFATLLATIPGLQIACGGPGFTEVWAGNKTLVAVCAQEEENQCQDIINRLNDGETVIVKDPLYYSPDSYGHRYDPLQDPGLGFDPETATFLVNRISPVSVVHGKSLSDALESNGKWIAETLISEGGKLIPLDESLLIDLVMREAYPRPSTLPQRIHEGELTSNNVLLRGCGGETEQLSPALL